MESEMGNRSKREEGIKFLPNFLTEATEKGATFSSGTETICLGFARLLEKE